MAAVMPALSRPTLEELTEAFEDEVAARCAIAFAGDCRLAVLIRAATERQIVYEFIVLSPGESPPGSGWTIYENRNGVAVGRSV